MMFFDMVPYVCGKEIRDFFERYVSLLVSESIDLLISKISVLSRVNLNLCNALSRLNIDL